MKYYVYALCDPRVPYSDDIFKYLPLYIGKGSGNRYEIHLREAKGLRKPSTANPMKVRALKEIYDCGLEPVLIKIEENLDSKSAYEREKSLIVRFGRKDIDENGILTNRVIDQRSLGGGKKGMSQKKKRDTTLWSQSHSGWVPSEETRKIWSLQRTGKKQTIEQKEHRSKKYSGSGNPNAIAWTITMPDGAIIEVKGLRGWCRENNIKYDDVYHSRNGFVSVKHGNGKGGRRR